MATYLLAYRGGSVAQTDEEREAAMAAWGAWFGSLGGAVSDAGNPFGPSATASSDGRISDGGTSSLTGYSIIQADDLATATTMIKDCPLLSSGGAVEVYETLPVM